MRPLILALVFALVASLALAGSGLQYGHGIQLGSVIVHYPTGDVEEYGDWEWMFLRRSPAYPRRYFETIVHWNSSNLDPGEHETWQNCNVFSPVEISAQEQ